LVVSTSKQAFSRLKALSRAEAGRPRAADASESIGPPLVIRRLAKRAYDRLPVKQVFDCPTVKRPYACLTVKQAYDCLPVESASHQDIVSAAEPRTGNNFSTMRRLNGIRKDCHTDDL
jgi:hypothetical protein